jgi:hypothetical protein
LTTGTPQLVAATHRKIRRRHQAGQLTVEQTHDATLIAAMLQRAGVTTPADFSSNCFLVAYIGDDPIGIAALESSPFHWCC